MMKTERYKIILNELRNKSSVVVADLALLCGVSRETIRTDLKKLDEQKMLSRTHGGAVNLDIISSLQNETPYFERESQNVQAKIEVAQKSLSYIQENDQIILDSSSTCVFLAKELPNIPLLVLTNSTRIVTELEKKDKIEVFCAGGMLIRNTRCFVGKDTLETISNYHINKAFLSCRGINQEGISELNEMAIVVKQKMVQISDEVYVLMDSSKFGIRDFSIVTTLDKIKYIITDNSISPDKKEILGEYAYKLIV